MRRVWRAVGAAFESLCLAAIPCAVAILCTAAIPGAAGAAEDPGKATAPRMEFVPPPPGSYTLQNIQSVSDAALLDDRGHPIRLASLTRGKITLLTFFYTYCVDPLGCPFAHTTLAALRDRVSADPALSRRVRFVSVSLDPTHDTPPAIARYAQEFTGPKFEWRFLTARSVVDLLPVLDDFGQDVSVETDENGRATRTMHHMLKMFLIDPHGEVREIYTLAFIQPPVMFNDIKTLALEAQIRTLHEFQTTAGRSR
jgi:cytochrome oxidase Cu insertion factor (SCO1/SenC/PrrC family)